MKVKDLLTLLSQMPGEADGAENGDEVRADQITSTKPRFNPGKLFKKTLDGIEFVKIAAEAD